MPTNAEECVHSPEFALFFDNIILQYVSNFFLDKHKTAI